MKVFDLIENQVVIEPQVMEIPEFKVLYKRDKTREKKEFFNQVKYIYYMSDVSSPYADFSIDVKETTVANDVFGKKYTPDDEVKMAMDKYNSLTSTPTKELLKAVKGKIMALSSYLTSVNVNEDTVSSILKVIESTSKLVGQLSVLQETVNKENEEAKQKVRGAKKIGRYEE